MEIEVLTFPREEKESRESPVSRETFPCEAKKNRTGLEVLAASLKGGRRRKRAEILEHAKHEAKKEGEYTGIVTQLRSSMSRFETVSARHLLINLLAVNFSGEKSIFVSFYSLAVVGTTRTNGERTSCGKFTNDNFKSLCGDEIPFTGMRDDWIVVGRCIVEASFCLTCCFFDDITMQMN